MRTRAPLFIGAALAGCTEYEVYKQDAADIFYQLEASKVDILLVVDNSCSMEPYQQKLGSNFDSFLTFFLEGDVDYQIGVTTTSASEAVYTSYYDPPCSQADIDAIPSPGTLVQDTIITPDTPDGESLFSDIVNVGICGDGSERGLASAKMALDFAALGTFNDGFIREDAFLSLIFVSDEQDSSYLGVNDYITAYQESKSAERASVNASALVVQDPASCTPSQQEYAVEGTRYIDVAEQTGGIVGDICGDDFESIITELSLSSSRLTDTFTLTALPAVESLVVGITDGDGEVYEVPCEDGEWIYDLQDETTPVIIFDRESLPPPNSKITVKYDRGDGDPARFCAAEGE